MIRGIAQTFGPVFRVFGRSLDSIGQAIEGGVVETLDRSSRFVPLKGKTPFVGADVFVAPNATVAGDVTIGAGSSVWYGAVIRGDVEKVKIGSHTHIKDRAMIHVARHNVKGNVLPTIIGDNVVVGAGAIVHACTLHNNAVIGANAIVLDGAVVEQGAVVAPGSIVPSGVTVKSGAVYSQKTSSPLDERDVAAQVKNHDELQTLSRKHAGEHAKTVAQYEKEEFEREYIAKDAY